MLINRRGFGSVVVAAFLPFEPVLSVEDRLLRYLKAAMPIHGLYRVYDCAPQHLVFRLVVVGCRCRWKQCFVDLEELSGVSFGAGVRLIRERLDGDDWRAG